MSYHELINIIITHRIKILKVTIFATVIIFLILFFIYPLTYRSTVTVLPPEENNRLGGVQSLLGGQDFSNLLLSEGTSGNSQLYMEILKSRSAALYVINKNNLDSFYGINNKYKAAEKLDKELNVEVSKEGIISLSVNVSTSLFPMFVGQRDSIKNLAASLSNSFVEALDKINREKLITKAQKTREFIGQQLMQTKTRLDSVENELMFFQEKNKAVSLPQQVNAAIDAAANIRAEIVKTEIEIGTLESNLREDNKTLIALKDKLQQLKDQYSKMEMGNQDYLLTFKNVPELGKKLANLLREVKIQNEVYSMLQQQYYKELIQENKDLPTIQVLDSAVPPLGAVSPRPIFSSVMGGIFVFFLMCFVSIYDQKRMYLFKKEK
ncbi:MAG: Wzz/FepE/Etk N-terminal domain-containing protein [Bacteroidetes bacterium]|nr:Wzz/FepE/Etk N-terminal domain-containing protein [Bacteroidota bacterium]